MSTFDITTAVEEFLNDAVRTSFELPHMTTGQRKNTKKLMEKYPELQCESYGLGADRKLVLFKKASQKIAQESKKSDNNDALVEVEVNIKNTFIHFKGRPQSDERAVQSMPHGMFRHCVLAEVSHGGNETASTGSGYDTPDTPTSTGEPDNFRELPESFRELIPMVTSEVANSEKCPRLGLGALVIVEGLTKIPAFNGCSAVIQGWDEEAQRYNILLAAPGGCQRAKVKQDNLRVVTSCP